MAYNTYLIDGIMISQGLGKTGFQASRMRYMRWGRRCFSMAQKRVCRNFGYPNPMDDHGLEPKKSRWE